MPWIAHIDGGARGNPGPAGAGVHIRDDAGKVVVAAGLFLGHKTNNEAEYAGMLAALDLLRAAGVDEAIVRSDSELLVRQMRGQYRVKAANLKPLYEQASDRVAEFKRVTFEHVPRERNRDADGLANQSMDAVGDVIEVDELNLAATLNRPAPSPTAPKGTAEQTARRSTPGRTASSPAAPRPADTAASAKRQSSATAAGKITLAVVKAPKAAACPANMRAGQTFAFSDITPAGLCVEACAAVIDAVASLRSMRETGASSQGPMVVTCQRPGCGAVFELRG